MSIDDLYKQQIEDTKKFSETIKEVRSLDRNIWGQLIAVQGTVLGISISLLGYQSISPSGWLLITWMLEIISISLGVVVMILDAKQTSRSAYYSYMFTMDFTDIQIKEAQGSFRSESEKKAGMVTAALLKNPYTRSEKLFTDKAKQLAATYKHELESSKLFNDFPKTLKNKVSDFLLVHFVKISDFFYVSFLLSFFTLLISLLMRE